MSRKSTEKTIEFTTFVYEDVQEGAPGKNDELLENSEASVPKSEKDSANESEDDKSSVHHSEVAAGLKTATSIVKQVKKHFCGVPSKHSSIQGKIESISCGDQTSFAIVKI